MYLESPIVELCPAASNVSGVLPHQLGVVSDPTRTLIPGSEGRHALRVEEYDLLQPVKVRLVFTYIKYCKS